MPVADDEQTVYERVGGQSFFDRLVDHFYEGVEADERLRPMYPADLEGAKQRLALFLAQYWGGPATYSERRGHPRLRMRHMRFPIGVAERDAWMQHMTAALDAVDPPDDLRPGFEHHFTSAADFLVNQTGEGRIPLSGG